MERYYRLLEVSHKATAAELATAYRRAALKWHPDKNPELKARCISFMSFELRRSTAS